MVDQLRFFDLSSVLKKSIFLLLLFGIVCHQESVVFGQDKKAKSETYQIQQQWLSTLGKQPGSAMPYNQSSGLMVEETLNIGTDAINAAIKELNSRDRFVRYDSVAYFQLYPGQLFAHGVYTTEKGQVFQSVIGWKQDNTWKKAFEAIGPKGKISEDSKTEIGLLRSSWELYSNQHRPDLIAKNVFAENGRYFYKGKEYIGDEIAMAYGYMKNESYSIDLTPKKVIQVNNQLVYEIGIYDTGGQGLYFLLWSKVGEDWKLLLDFNF
ncbi:hypothetical protein [Muriicola soli]|uniref:Uncharacterized protein n=1 Tax=Muriicola soli TaxID=2507538 RepID=A0A411E798_9FLAO|nr:hypothetical protein [Muriicola soli]QBA63393.1 hypothetical protein EQY75_01800 [Muriicola soli]